MFYYAIGHHVGDNNPSRKKVKTVSSLYKRILNDITILDVDVKRANDKKYIDNKKKGLSYIMLARLDGKGRFDHNVLESSGACLDIDDSELEFDEILDILDDLNFSYCVHTTFKHKFGKYSNRYRVFIPYKAPIDGDTHVLVYKYLHNLIDPDTKCTTFNPSRVLFLPAVPDCTKDKFDSHFVLPDKKVGLFDPAALSDEELEGDDESWAFQGVHSKAAYKETLEDNDGQVIDGGRNNTLYSYACSLIAKGNLSEPSLVQEAELFVKLRMGEKLDKTEIARTVKSALDKHRRNNDLQTAKEIVKAKIDLGERLELLAKNKTAGVIQFEAEENALKQMSKTSDIPLTSIRKEYKKALTSAKKDLKNKEHKAIESEAMKDQGMQSSSVSREELKKLVRPYVYVVMSNTVYDTRIGTELSPESFNTSMAKLQTIDGVTVDVLKSLNKLGAIRCVQAMRFDPAQDKFFKKDGFEYINTYEQVKHKLLDVYKVRPMLKHFMFLIPDERERKIILQFIAFMIQRPEERVRWMPIIKGGKGTGKSMIISKIIIPLLGLRNVFKFEAEDFMERFNDWQANKRFLYCEEFQFGRSSHAKKDRLADAMKSVVSDDVLKIEAKYKKPEIINNYNCLFALTNHDLILTISRDERRFCFIESKAKPKSRQYYIDFAHWCENNINEIYSYFMELSLDGFNSDTAPSTKYTTYIKAASEPWAIRAVKILVSEYRDRLGKLDFVTWEYIVSLIFNICESHDLLEEKYFNTLRSPKKSQGLALASTLADAGFNLIIRKDGYTDIVRRKGVSHIVLINNNKNSFTKISDTKPSIFSDNLSTMDEYLKDNPDISQYKHFC